MNIITLPKPPKLVKKEGNLGIFEIDDIYPGYGVTLANALRRVMLSSLQGAAVTSAKIRNVAHEFSTLPHVKEDIVEIILNLKQLRFKLFGDEPVKINISAKGEGKITAADIKAGSQVEVINKNAPIATLTNKNAELNIELTVEKGMGYLTVEQQAKGKKETGVIAIDAIFSPVRKVGYEVENARVGQRTDYNKITFEIETDGSIDPEDALSQSAEILIKQFEAIRLISGKVIGKEEIISDIIAVEKEIKKVKEIAKEPQKDESVLLKSVEDIKFSTRTMAALKENKLKTAGAICKKSEADLLEMPKMGAVSVKEIKKELGKLGLVLKQ
ncbi:DNA-directed RNA polymerase subunit alpha [Patescibacteria group bacterium]|nr:DNA-directed RNA polymerase subunit alpha [Patescibacteria group bacterium]MBU4338268.1 DNA-directed RNA polymerase subunit alpha [Patescibacteria group bacterium]MBU4579951.1 DNA-directed RNA polymerase subunit alpha [Patescibacteria group bacterium]